MSLPGSGREDHAVPLLNWRTRANITLVVLAVCAVLIWHVAVAVTTGGVGILDAGVSLRALVGGHPLSGLASSGAPGARPPAAGLVLGVWLVLVLLLFAVFVGWAFAWGTWRARRRRGLGFAGGREVREQMGTDRARASAAQTRAGLSEKDRRDAAATEIGLPLGETATGGEPVVLSLEDHVVVVSPTGAGKTRDVMIPAALDAPGAVVVTCTRADVLDVIATRRTTSSGGYGRRVWVFDPLDRIGWPEPMVWDPVAGCRSGARAISRGLAFAAGLGADDTSATNTGFFRANASSALTRLLHAADLSGKTIADVVDWAVHLDDGAEEAQQIIRTSTDPQAERMWAGMLRSVATGADETVASSRQTLQQAIEPLALRTVLAWVTPRPGVPAFDATDFVNSRDTLVLVADANSSTNVAPLCAMLLQEVVDAAKASAARRPGGRIDPPLRLVGDEIANVAPLPKLPDLGTDARGFGLQLVLAIQSLAQARRRWGSDGAATLLDNMAAELLLGGLTDIDALNRYANLVGQVELTRATTSYEGDSGRTTGSSEQLLERQALRADEARRIPDRHALLLYRNSAAVLLRMTPWFERPDASELQEQRHVTESRRLAGHEPGSAGARPW